MNKKETIKKIADDISRSLLEEGFDILRYDSYSSNSVYLKVDFGVCHTIRISDHPGKKHLHYRYNVLLTAKKHTCTNWNYEPGKQLPLHVYSPKEVDYLIKRIIKTRKQKVDKYGAHRYNGYKELNARQNAYKMGFWRQAYPVTLPKQK